MIRRLPAKRGFCRNGITWSVEKVSGCVIRRLSVGKVCRGYVFFVVISLKVKFLRKESDKTYCNELKSKKGSDCCAFLLGNVAEIPRTSPKQPRSAVDGVFMREKPLFFKRVDGFI